MYVSVSAGTNTEENFFPTHQNGFELYNILHSLCIDGF